METQAAGELLLSDLWSAPPSGGSDSLASPAGLRRATAWIREHQALSDQGGTRVARTTAINEKGEQSASAALF